MHLRSAKRRLSSENFNEIADDFSEENSATFAGVLVKQ